MPEHYRGASPISCQLLLEWWKPIPGWEDLYEISNVGNIRSLRTGRLRSAFPNKKGYLIVQLHRDKKATAKQVHPLVAHCFVGPRPPGMLVNHKNGTKWWNRVSNLEYMTPLENTRHAIEAGLYKPGSYQSKLDEHDVAVIRELLSFGLYTVEIASLYCIDASVISRIKNGKHKTRPQDAIRGFEMKGSSHPRSKLTEADVIEIRRVRTTWSLKQLAQRFNVSETIISDAALGKTWKHLPGAIPKQKGGGPRRAAPVFDPVKEACSSLP